MPPKEETSAASQVEIKGFVKPPPYLEMNENMAVTWKNWLQQYKWFEIVSKLKQQPAEYQAATFMSIIGPEAINIYNSFSSSRTTLHLKSVLHLKDIHLTK